MNSEDEDLDEAEAAEEMDQHGLALHQQIEDYLDEHDLDDDAGVIILLGIAIRMRMVTYALETEHPSASGLKMDLDRFQRVIEDAIRTAKKSAEEFVEEAKTVREQAEAEVAAEDEEEVDDGKGVPS
jgi:nucleotide-binding universal stress UspA family protein